MYKKASWKRYSFLVHRRPPGGHDRITETQTGSGGILRPEICAMIINMCVFVPALGHGTKNPVILQPRFNNQTWPWALEQSSPSKTSKRRDSRYVRLGFPLSTVGIEPYPCRVNGHVAGSGTMWFAWPNTVTHFYLWPYHIILPSLPTSAIFICPVWMTSGGVFK